MRKYFYIFPTVALLLFFPSASGQETSQPAPQVRIVIDDQIRAFLEKDHQRAYSHAAPSIKQIFPTVEQFVTMVKRGYRPVYEPKTYDFGQSEIQGDEVVQRVNLTGPNGKNWTAIYTLKQQSDGSWKITGVYLREVEAPAV